MFSDQTQNSVARIITIMEWLAVSFFVLSLSLSLSLFCFVLRLSLSVFALVLMPINLYERQTEQEIVCEQASMHEYMCVSRSHIKCTSNLYVSM